MPKKCHRLDSTLVLFPSYPYPFFSFFCMYLLVHTMQQVSRDAKTFFSQYVKIAAEVAAIQQLALCTTLGSIVVYTSVVYMRYIYTYTHTHCSWQHNRSFSEKSWKMRWTIATIQKDGNEWCEKGKHCTMGSKWWNIERNHIKIFEFDYNVPLPTIMLLLSCLLWPLEPKYCILPKPPRLKSGLVIPCSKKTLCDFGLSLWILEHCAI